jgi:four helix bundle protein
MKNQNAQPAGHEVTTVPRSNGRVPGTGDDFAARVTGRPLSPSGSGNGLDTSDCYRLAVEFAALAAGLVPRGHASLRDQLERASTSVLLNLAEGWGYCQARQKAQFYTIARGSLLESGAAIDLLRARGLADEADCERARVLCTRIGQMLGGLIRSTERRISTAGHA